MVWGPIDKLTFAEITIMTRPKKRQKLGVGYIWFSGEGLGGSGYSCVSLTASPHGEGGMRGLKIGRLGGWQRVRLYAEYTEGRSAKR